MQDVVRTVTQKRLWPHPAMRSMSQWRCADKRSRKQSSVLRGTSPSAAISTQVMHECALLIQLTKFQKLTKSNQPDHAGSQIPHAARAMRSRNVAKRGDPSHAWATPPCGSEYVRVSGCYRVGRLKHPAKHQTEEDALGVLSSCKPSGREGSCVMEALLR